MNSLYEYKNWESQKVYHFAVVILAEMLGNDFCR